MNPSPEPRHCTNVRLNIHGRTRLMSTGRMSVSVTGRTSVSVTGWTSVSVTGRTSVSVTGRTSRASLHNILNTNIVMGGYFDAEGNAYYYLTDYQGNVTGVIDSNAKIVQETGYYPYGEPWLEPEGDNPYLYGGKERMALGGVRYSDFGPRLLSTASGYWGSPDPLLEKTPDLSPYINCAANPVRNIDPTGEDVCVLIKPLHIALLIQGDKDAYGNRRWSYFSINGDNVYSSSSHSSGRPFDDLDVGSWESPEDFLNSDYNKECGNDDPSVNGYGYEEGYLINSSPEQDSKIKNEFEQISKETEYDLILNNCATTVVSALKAGGIDAGSNISPFQNYPFSINNMYMDTYYNGDFNHNVKAILDRFVPASVYDVIKSKNPNGKTIKKTK